MAAAHQHYHWAGIIEELKNLACLNCISHKQVTCSFQDGYGIRIKGIYLISSSKTIDALVKIVKQFISAKIAQRINVVKSPESLHEVFPKCLLPKYLGGEQKSMLELFDENIEELSSESHILHMMEMRHACTDENLRRNNKCNEEYLGLPGSFRILSVD
ncbi:uncharacterized protein LOC133516632 [Cydia pomonella]|uniref:uncharacterized protein LOC133516632 n=1 Tax=Cydia pomonella TaxID=82600 RepID=UPI002ADD56C7|nr:uncharacterized protein LOC133516632 [Cydia pomonella]